MKTYPNVEQDVNGKGGFYGNAWQLMATIVLEVIPCSIFEKFQ